MLDNVVQVVKGWPIYSLLISDCSLSVCKYDAVKFVQCALTVIVFGHIELNCFQSQWQKGRSPEMLF